MNEPHSPFAGVFTALVTPFRDGAVDLAAFDRL
ncbi:MAG: 4-hydroxy-tetrahydrodipicolinate synthase, partial [Bauldia sp.]